MDNNTTDKRIFDKNNAVTRFDHEPVNFIGLREVLLFELPSGELVWTNIYGEDANHKPILETDQWPRVSFGDTVIIHGETYIIAQVDVHKCTLISADCGNRYSDPPVQVKTAAVITREEFLSMLGKHNDHMLDTIIATLDHRYRD